MQFAIGDKVRVDNAAGDIAGSFVGLEGMVDGFEADHTYPIRVLLKESIVGLVWFKESELEKVEG